MPSTVNGTGTTFYGRRDVGVDGSYVTTKWGVLLYVPLFPLGSFRVRETGNSKDWWSYGARKYLAQEVPLNGYQVRKGYIATAVVATVVYLAMRS